MKDLDDFTIAIVGLGLMGGSLALALKQNRVGRSVLGADVSRDTVQRAVALGAVDGTWRPGAPADLVILATPVRAIVQWLRANGVALPPDCLLMDLGSTKQEIVAAMDILAVASIGGHPMCGKETSGLAFADAALFRGAKFALTPTARTTDRAMGVARALAERIGAQPVVLSAAAHDRAVAAISHLPYLLSANLVNTVGALGDDNAALLAASGYAGMTRLAASDTRMMGDIIATNRAAIVEALDRFAEQLARLRAQIVTGDEAGWRAALEEARGRKTDP